MKVRLHLQGTQDFLSSVKSETDSERIFTCDAGVDAAHMKASKACQRRLKTVTAVKMAELRLTKLGIREFYFTL